MGIGRQMARAPAVDTVANSVVLRISTNPLRRPGDGIDLADG